MKKSELYDPFTLKKIRGLYGKRITFKMDTDEEKGKVDRKNSIHPSNQSFYNDSRGNKGVE